MKIYVLRLKQGKFYIGQTNKAIQERLEEHKSGINAAAWTRKYPPMSVLYEFTTTDRGVEMAKDWLTG
jgi:predicted GIY-YIG superfamily endonuclease